MEIQRSEGEIILFIDECTRWSAQAEMPHAMDASNMLEPALAHGELQ